MNALKVSAPATHAMEEKALKSSANLERMIEFDSSISSHIVHEAGQGNGPKCPLDVLQRMEAREKFVVGVLESTYAIDQSIQESEYLYLRRLRLLIGVSDAEFEYFAEKSGFADQSADRAKLEAGKRKAEDEVVSYLEKNIKRIYEQVPKVLERCHLATSTAEDKRACKLSLHNQERLARAAEKNLEDATALLLEEDASLTESEMQQRHEEFLSLAYEFKKYCEMSEKSTTRDTLYTQLNRELDWWRRHHKRQLEDRSNQEYKKKGTLMTQGEKDKLREAGRREEEDRLVDEEEKEERKEERREAQRKEAQRKQREVEQKLKETYRNKRKQEREQKGAEVAKIKQMKASKHADNRKDFWLFYYRWTTSNLRY
jgi:hypothetical protein